MKASVRHVGLDVHAETIVIAVAEGDTPAQFLKTIPFDEPRLLKELRKLGELAELRVCYEAGPTGFGLQRFLRGKGVVCSVIAPSMVPKQAGVRIKTDRRDACNLAHYLRAGNLTEVWVPDEHTEAMRDLERARDDARLAERRARQHLLKFLLRNDHRFTEGKQNWTLKHWAWIARQRFEDPAQQVVFDDYVQTAQQAHERVERLTHHIAELVDEWVLAPLVRNLQAFHGIDLVTAVGVAAEVGNFERFERASGFMAYMGLVPSEHTTGPTRRQGGITKTGNRHVRRLLMEAAWHYYNSTPVVSATLQKRRENVAPEITAIADKARLRLRAKAARMKRACKTPNKIAVALARELAGFIWAAARATLPPQVASPGSGPRERAATYEMDLRSLRRRPVPAR
jgi:transposase